MLHPLTEKLLISRGFVNREEQERFLFPDYTRDIGDPFNILNMDRAVGRIILALEKGERIAIYGDYDCDGIPGSVILHDLFKKIGYTNFTNYIPHRHVEGYGLNMRAIEKLAHDGVGLIVTVDCGITDVEEVVYANELGIDVIITDHHLPQEHLPPAYAVVNSKQEGDVYHDKMLCGAGVAWKLASALLARGNFSSIPAGWEKWLLDMAGLSTIADMVPVLNENRALAYYGLKVLRRSPRPGLQALLADTGVTQRFLTEEDVGFLIAPRINAASRMDVPLRAFELLATTDGAVALERAAHLTALNGSRKLEVARIIKEARGILASRSIPEIIVLGNPRWNVGVVGIVANQLAEEFDRPVFVWGREGSTHTRGSCRSDGRINMVELMSAVSDGVFLESGGHEFSGGFSVSDQGIHCLEKELLAAYARISKKEKKKEAVAVEETLRLADVSDETFDAINLLAPFGVGNPKPNFLFPRVTIVAAEQFGKGKNHLKLLLSDASGGRCEAIAFFRSPEHYAAVDLSRGSTVNLVATIERSYFRGWRTLRLKITEISP